MEFLAFGFIPLIFFPLIVVIGFRGAFVARKSKEIIEELHKLRAMDVQLVRGWGGESGISSAVENYYSRSGLLVPASLLTFFYAVAFLLSYVYLLMIFCNCELWHSCRAFLLAARPCLMAFVGVYLFNMGTTVRRLYLNDLSEHVFWSSINRLLLSLGLAVVISTAYKLGRDPDKEIQQYFYFVFFAIGFLANVFLGWVMEVALRITKIGKPKVSELPLQMVEGINIWREFRLEEEGIEGVQNLATADVIDLAVKTHFNIRTLIDWIDQAILLDRLGVKARLLADKAFIKGAIDLAWKSPLSTGNTTTAGLVAQVLEADPQLTADLMDNLYQDAQVQTIWTLWQTKREISAAE